MPGVICVAPVIGNFFNTKRRELELFRLELRILQSIDVDVTPHRELADLFLRLEYRASGEA